MECSEAMDVPNEILLEANAININYLIPKSSKKCTNCCITSLSVNREK